LFACWGAASNLWFLPIAIVRCVFGAAKGAVAAATLAPAFSLACAATALLWTPRIFMQSCKGLGAGHCCAACVSLLVLPVRAPLVLTLSFVGIIPLTMGWVMMSTLFFSELDCCHLLAGGVVSYGDYSGVVEVVMRLSRDTWRYHKHWSFEGEELNEVRPVPAPTVLGDPDLHDMEADSAMGSVLPTQSWTIRHLFGEFSMKEVWAVCLSRAVTLGIELHAAGRVSTEDLDGMEPFLFIGLPAVAVVQLAHRSLGQDGLVFGHGGMIVTSENRPHNAFADGVWHAAMRAKRALQEASPVSEAERDFLELTALNRPSLDPSLFDVAEQRKVELNPVITAAVELSIIASRSAQFKSSMGCVFQQILAKVALETA